MISSRQKLILKAIIESVIENGDPVGSFELIKKPYLNMSSATIRGDMANLEELGYLLKTHTSSGRIPSNKGYKYYIDNLITVDDSILYYYPLIDKIIKDNKHQKIMAIEKTIKWLSEITNTTAFTICQRTSDILIKKISLERIDDNLIFLLIFVSSGNIQSQTISPDILEVMSFEELKDIIDKIEICLLNRTINEAIKILKTKEFSDRILKNSSEKDRILLLFNDLIHKLYKENIHLSGFENIFANASVDNVGLLKKYQNELTEENIISLLSNDKTLEVRIDDEISFMPEANCAIVSIPYQIYENESGQLALIGSKRMPYKVIVPLLEYIASKLSNLYK